MLLGLVCALLCAAASFGWDSNVSLWRVLQFQALPATGAALWRWRRETYLK